MDISSSGISSSRGAHTSPIPPPSPPSPPWLLLTASYATRHLPIEVVILILSYLSVLPPTQSYHPTQLLLLSHSLSQPLLPHVFTHIRLDTVHSVTSFASHLRQNPTRARLVRSLAITPTAPHSDLYYALPSQGTSSGTPLTSLVLSILRSCRRLAHVFFEGSLVGADLVRTYGTASQPRSVVCVNPRSFLAGFSAPFFARTTRVLLVDNSLTDEEVDEVHRMRALQHFTWLIPKPGVDGSRDSRILLRLAGANVQQEQLRVVIAGNAPVLPPAPAPPAPALPASRRAAHLHTVHVRTTAAQRAQLVDPLERLVRNAAAGADADAGPTLTPLSAMRSSVHLARATLQLAHEGASVALEASLVEPSFVRDWDALRDAVCTPSRTASTSVFGADAAPPVSGEEGEEVDGGRALRDLLQEWEAWVRSSRADA